MSPRNRLTDLHKIWHGWLRHRRHSIPNMACQAVQGHFPAKMPNLTTAISPEQWVQWRSNLKHNQRPRGANSKIKELGHVFGWTLKGLLRGLTATHSIRRISGSTSRRISSKSCNISSSDVNVNYNYISLKRYQRGKVPTTFVVLLWLAVSAVQFTVLYCDCYSNSNSMLITMNDSLFHSSASNSNTVVQNCCKGRSNSN